MAFTAMGTAVTTNTTGGATAITGGLVVFNANGTFGGATVGIDASYDGGTTYYATGLTFTSAGIKTFQGPAATYRYNITGGTSASLNVGYAAKDADTPSNQINTLYNTQLGLGTSLASQRATTT